MESDTRSLLHVRHVSNNTPATWSAANGGQDGDDLSSMPTSDQALTDALAAAWQPAA